MATRVCATGREEKGGERVVGKAGEKENGEGGKWTRQGWKSPRKGREGRPWYHKRGQAHGTTREGRPMHGWSTGQNHYRGTRRANEELCKQLTSHGRGTA